MGKTEGEIHSFKYPATIWQVCHLLHPFSPVGTNVNRGKTAAYKNWTQQHNIEPTTWKRGGCSLSHRQSLPTSKLRCKRPTIFKGYRMQRYLLSWCKEPIPCKSLKYTYAKGPATCLTHVYWHWKPQSSISQTKRQGESMPRLNLDDEGKHQS